MRYALSALIGLLALGSGCERRWPWQSPVTFMDPREVDAQLNEMSFRESVQRIGNDPEVAKQFAKVAEDYERSRVPSSARYHNLGNAHLLADQLPEAILAYHRGLRLNPNDAGLRANLDYARAKVPYPFGNRGRPEDDFWPSWFYRPSPFQVLMVALGAYTLAWVLATRWYITRRRQLLIRTFVVFFVAAVGGFTWYYLKNENALLDRYPLVVIREDKLPLRKGNGPSYPANPELPVLARGMEARRMHERGGWLQIQLAGGEVGWVEKAAVIVDEP